MRLQGDQLAFAHRLNLCVVWHRMLVCIFTGIRLLKAFALKISKVWAIRWDWTTLKVPQDCITDQLMFYAFWQALECVLVSHWKYQKCVAWICMELDWKCREIAHMLNICGVWHGISVCIFAAIRMCNGFALKMTRVWHEQALNCLEGVARMQTDQLAHAHTLNIYL